MWLMRHRDQQSLANCFQPRFVLQDEGKGPHLRSGKAPDYRVHVADDEPCHLLLKDLRMKEDVTVAAAVERVH